MNALLITRYIWLEFRKRYCSILKSLLIKQLFLPSKTKSTTVAFFFSPPSLLLAHPFRLFLFLPWYNFQACRTVFWTFLIMWLHFQINILTKKEKKKQQLNRNEVTYILSSYWGHLFDSRFESISTVDFHHFWYPTGDRLNPTVSKKNLTISHKASIYANFLKVNQPFQDVNFTVNLSQA